MIIDILSDIHLDFYFRQHQPSDREIQIVFDPLLATAKADMLIVAGDIGHYNSQNIYVLKQIQKIYQYKYIVCVLGNHDYYLLSNSSKHEYFYNSQLRAKAMRDLTNQEEGMYCLDGEVIDIDGIKIGGADSWYDGKYIIRNFPDYRKEDINGLYEYVMNDANYVLGVSWIELSQEEKKKIELIYQDVDIMITHVNPSLYPEHTSSQFREEKTTGFFTFDGENYVKNGTMKYWIFGHTHIANEFNFHGVKCICNPMGYPRENNQIKISQINTDNFIDIEKRNETII